MLVFRASRRPRASFDPLDSRASVARSGWRFNDKRHEILYAAERQALAILEVAARPGWDTLDELNVALLEVPDGGIRDLADLGINPAHELECPPRGAECPAHRRRVPGGGGTARPSPGGTSAACACRRSSARRTSPSCWTPRQKSSYAVADWARIPFNWLLGTAT